MQEHEQHPHQCCCLLSPTFARPQTLLYTCPCPIAIHPHKGLQCEPSAADVDHIDLVTDLVLINRRLRRFRANLRPHAKLESVHLVQSNVPDDVDGPDIMRPRSSHRHCAKTKLESPLEDLHGPSASSDLQGALITRHSSSTAARTHEDPEG